MVGGGKGEDSGQSPVLPGLGRIAEQELRAGGPSRGSEQELRAGVPSAVRCTESSPHQVCPGRCGCRALSLPSIPVVWPPSHAWAPGCPHRQTLRQEAHTPGVTQLRLSGGTDGSDVRQPRCRTVKK